jgi:hypothetical protein
LNIEQEISNIEGKEILAGLCALSVVLKRDFVFSVAAARVISNMETEKRIAIAMPSFIRHRLMAVTGIKVFLFRFVHSVHMNTMNSLVIIALYGLKSPESSKMA